MHIAQITYYILKLFQRATDQKLARNQSMSDRVLSHDDHHVEVNEKSNTSENVIKSYSTQGLSDDAKHLRTF